MDLGVPFVPNRFIQMQGSKSPMDPNGIPGRSSVGKAFAAFNFLLFQCHVVIPLFFAYWFLVDQAALQFN